MIFHRYRLCTVGLSHFSEHIYTSHTSDAQNVHLTPEVLNKTLFARRLGVSPSVLGGHSGTVLLVSSSTHELRTNHPGMDGRCLHRHMYWSIYMDGLV